MSFLERACAGFVFGLAAVLTSFGAMADEPAGAAAPASLLEYWLAVPQIETIAWPFAYIRADTTMAAERTRRRDLLNEFDQLAWRLKGSGYRDLATTIQTWRRNLSAVERYRVPGRWGPAWLMAHPQQNPPLERVDAIGACDSPAWIEIWDRHGITRIDWHSGMTLASLLNDHSDLNDDVSTVALVGVTGEISHRGVAPWNFSDAGLSPGMRVVAPLPLNGEAFPWIRDAIANLLAHTPSGERCREVVIGAKPRNG